MCLCAHFFLTRVLCVRVISAHIWLWRHAIPPERDWKHHYCPAAPRPRERSTCQVMKTFQMPVSNLGNICNSVLKSPPSPSSVQYIPGGGWRGDRKEGEEGAGASGVFSIAYVPWWGAGPWYATLLHGRAAPQQPARSQPLHCGGQSYLQRLLEQPFGPTQKLPCLLPGNEQLQRGECFVNPHQQCSRSGNSKH